jgi:DNA-directed RNA polymerase alpha subunit
MTSDQPASDLPPKLGNPARRALAAAGYTRLDQLATVSEADLKKLHGVGPKALDQIRRALAAKGQTSIADPANDAP